MSKNCDCPLKGSCSCSSCNHEDCFGEFHRYCIIKASAGTGKTYQLAMRFIQLLSFGVSPETVLALTFTRKAAGEIYSRIITRLLGMLEHNVFCCNLNHKKLVAILRALLNSSNSLQISTIDSFFTKIINSFAPELGIWGKNSIVDYEDNRYRRDVLYHWIPELSKDKKELDELRELLKTLNNNQENVMLESSLLSLMDNMYAFYLRYETSDENPVSWGCTMDIQPDPYQQNIQSYLDDLDFLKQKAQEGILYSDNDGKESPNATYQKRLNAYVDFARNIKTVYIGIVPEDVKSLLNNFTENTGNDWCLNREELFYTKKLIVPQDVAVCIRSTFLHIAFLALVQSEKRTAAVYRLLRKFDVLYTEQIRNYGKLTFSDLPYLLAKSYQNENSVIAGNPMETLEYRLDSKIEHYMFDEFQDTSDSQWKIFDRMTSNQLLSSIPEDFRSFFCVGDIKQSIYGWRGGNPKLFQYLEYKTSAFEEELGYCPTISLSKSFRASQSVLELVNQVFSDSHNSNLEPSCLQELDFIAHSTALDCSGFSSLLVMPKIKRDSNEDPIFRNATVIFRILKKIQPERKNLSVGILVQTNKNAKAYWDALTYLAFRERSGMQFSAEGRSPLTDSNAFCVLKQLLILAEHPGDRTAIEYLHMLLFTNDPNHHELSPISETVLIEKLGLGQGKHDLASAVRHEIARNGLPSFISRFISVYGIYLPVRDCKKLESIRLLAEEYSGSTDDFLRYLDNANQNEKTIANTIQIMTIHKSKGLEFDILFTPEIGNHRGNSGFSLFPMVDIPDVSMSYNAEFMKPKWISYFPDDILIRHVPAYAEYQKKAENLENFAKLCKTYVALTRAKRALFVMVQPPEKATQFAPDQWIQKKLEIAGQGQRNEDIDLFRDSLQEKLIAGIPYTHGNPEWFQDIEMKENAVQPSSQHSLLHVKMVSSEQHTRLASKEHKLQIRIQPDKRFTMKPITEIGTLVHELFEQIEFLSESWNADSFFADYLLKNTNSAVLDALDILKKATATDSPIYHALLRPSGNPQLWRERRFLLMNEAKELIPGAFDRVLIWRNSNGIPYHAEIDDFKSDALKLPSEFLERHQGQLNLYRKSLSKMLGLNESGIVCKIFALRPSLVINVPNDNTLPFS